ncbi:penicillin-binding protein 2 [Flavobacteriales bacterium]|jgi:penicillin-binding protein 2|nr:penicillin-binding protein 2 [Flavobacteriales bacterium]MDB2362034.1 penicillin-binding protein 2 [Flavobacteriales bacterium]
MRKFENRPYIIGGFFSVIIIIFIVRLFSIQVVDDSFKTSSENNVIRKETDHPRRGLIYDRNNELIVYNEAAYDLMITPNQANSIDTNLICSLLSIDTLALEKRLEKAKSYSMYKSSVFMKQISVETYTKLQENMFLMPGFYVQARTLRKYPYSTASHLLGYVGEVNQQIIKKNPYYKEGDYIGVSGIEKAYEDKLKGIKGEKLLLKDVHNNIKGSFKNGKFDTKSIPGKNLTSSIDIFLQNYGEQLMKNKRGSVVAIEPSTGEILCLVSAPNYDPNTLVGRKRSENYTVLNNDSINKPLFNRAALAQYPPGSTFKLINALIGLQEKVIKSSTHFECDDGFVYGEEKRKMKCHEHRSPLNLEESIANSCNAYFCNVYKSIIENYPTTYEGYDAWRNYVMSFGLGNWLNNDLPTGQKGFVPNKNYYDRIYGKKRWKSLTNLSLSIGQDALLTTPIQMANMTAAIANRGYYYTPHIIKKIESDSIESRFKTKIYTEIDSSYFDIVIKGMQEVVENKELGTSNIAKMDDVTVCGKTGTAQNPHGKDHSIFIGFAPKDKPKIALAVYVENGGWGSTWAVPIGSLMIEKYINDTISRQYLEERIVNGEIEY